MFVDTNVLIYSISSDPAEHDKAERAKHVLGQRDLGLSVQVLQEFYVQATVRSLGCDTVLSEDLSDGQDYDGVGVENPFRAGGDR